MQGARRSFATQCLSMLAIFMLLGISSASRAADTVTYSYDIVGRVTSAAYDNGLCIIYAYDANGNRTAQSYSTSSAPTSQNWGSGVWGCYLKWTPS